MRAYLLKEYVYIESAPIRRIGAQDRHIKCGIYMHWSQLRLFRDEIETIMRIHLIDKDFGIL
jgi:hypothetical protein